MQTSCKFLKITALKGSTFKVKLTIKHTQHMYSLYCLPPVFSLFFLFLRKLNTVLRMGSVVLVPEVWDAFLIRSAVPSEAEEATSAVVLATPHLSVIARSAVGLDGGRFQNKK